MRELRPQQVTEDPVENTAEAGIAALAELGAALRTRLFERDVVVEGLIGALVAGEHVMLLGPPGTAKSLLARMVCDGLSGARFFQWLLTRFSTPEELFGPLDLGALEAGRYERLTEGQLPTAHVAFLDEIFKASSAILNTLLTLLNERRFHNAGQAVAVPLVCLVAASNEVPDEEGLAALYDRFLLRFWVAPIQEDARFVAMLAAPAPDATPLPTVSLGQLAATRAAAAEVPVQRVVLESLARIRRGLDSRGIEVSDRRFRQLLGYLRARALMAGDAAVTEAHLPLTVDVLWSDPEDVDAVREVVAEVASGFERDAAELVGRAEEVIAYARRAWETPEEEARAVIEAHAKLTRLLTDADRLVSQEGQRGAPGAGVVAARDRVAALVSQLVEEGF